jgi:hypothetical protein
LHISLLRTGSTGIFAKGIVRGNTIVNTFPGAPSEIGIDATGIVTDNYVSVVGQGVSVGAPVGVGISASGTVRGNTVVNGGNGIVVGVGSTAIGNTATNNSVSGIEANCPANLTDNTAVNNGTNLVLNGADRQNEDNVTP